jgi:hypothetical protein
MPSLKRIVCLANSWKLGERCIAGVDMDTGKWVRPVCDNSYPKDGRVPRSIRLIGGREPRLLDVLQIPLASTGNDFGFECENLSVASGEWKFLGQVQPTALVRIRSNFPYILHNSSKYVNPSALRALPFPQRRTLQLIRASSFSVTKSSQGNTGWRGTLRTINGQTLKDAKITDPVFAERLEAGYQPTGSYWVTVSLSMPWAPTDDWSEAPCWKLIAGVIEVQHMKN